MENPLYVGIAAVSDVCTARERHNISQWEPEGWRDNVVYCAEGEVGKVSVTNLSTQLCQRDSFFFEGIVSLPIVLHWICIRFGARFDD
jgi:hypothetical protein